MGAILSFIFPPTYCRGLEPRVLMLGLDGAGKTTILQRQRFGTVEQTIPTIGFNVETLTIGKIHFTVWDIGGQEKIRPLYRHYYPGARVIVFVVDSTDRERLSEARLEIRGILSEDELKDIGFLILANKQDSEGALDLEELKKELFVDELDKHRWHIQAASALTGKGLNEAFKWVATTGLYPDR